jgi:hypothetical protein
MSGEKNDRGLEDGLRERGMPGEGASRARFSGARLHPLSAETAPGDEVTGSPASLRERGGEAAGSERAGSMELFLYEADRGSVWVGSAAGGRGVAEIGSEPRNEEGKVGRS